MTLYAAFTNDGDILTRNSNREYTHAALSGKVKRVEARDGEGLEEVAMADDGELGFCGRRDLAEKTVAKWRRLYPNAYVTEVLKVTVAQDGKGGDWFAQVGKTSLVARARTKGEVIDKVKANDFS